MKSGYIGQAWLVLVLALCFGAALAGVEATLSDRIKANKVAETLQQVPKLVPGAETGEVAELGGSILYRAMAGGKQVGWVVPAGGSGFADKIELLIGLDAQAKTVTGLYVLDNKETPGLGNRIAEPAWEAQFAGTDAARPLAVVKGAAGRGANQIAAVTGATISSESVCAIVNKTLGAMREMLAREARKD